MIIYGLNPVNDFIDLYKERILKIYITNKFKRNSLKAISSSLPETPIEIVTEKKIQLITNSIKHQAIAAEILIDSIKNFSDLKKVLPDIDRILILDHIQDPQNLGAISRTCVFFGIRDIVIPKVRTVSISAGAVKASAGAIFSTNIYEVSNLVNIIKDLKKRDYWVIGADTKGDSFTDTKFDRFKDEKIVIVMGSEKKGLSNLVRGNCDILLKIKRNGPTDSLNVSVAAGLIINRFNND
jgi:23S rRNA (guanosine2251-2'-O)-methyltransferase|tara:strand:- start:2052 stop:2768 length:717 start_codon:yes stop_codon:yes gene_type:complete